MVKTEETTGKVVTATVLLSREATGRTIDEPKRLSEAGMLLFWRNFGEDAEFAFPSREGSENVTQSNLHVSGLAPKIDHEELIRFFGAIGPVSALCRACCVSR